jgi:hypothetical protein
MKSEVDESRFGQVAGPMTPEDAVVASLRGLLHVT